MSDQTPSPAEMFAGLRDQLFRGDLETLAPVARGSAVSDTGPEVIGVAMEVAFDGGSSLVFGLRDGSASVYLSTGGGWIGGQGRPHINAAARKLVDTARAFVVRIPAVEKYPLPTVGRVRFSILTSAGVRAAEADEAELMRGRGELLPLFAAAQGIITGFRLIEEPEPQNELSYVNCLLTTLARGKAASITLTEGTQPPDPAQLTADVTDLQWIADIGFSLHRLSSAKIIRLLLQLAGFRWFRIGKSEGRIQAKVAAHGGESLSDANFRVLRWRREGRVQIEVTAVHRTE